MTRPSLVWVAITASLWCAAHSLLITLRVQDWLHRSLGRYHAYIRLAYNIISLISLGALSWWWFHLPATTLFAWSGTWQVMRIAGLALALFFFWAGSRVYDGHSFLGLRQINAARRGLPTRRPRIQRREILGRIRHPYYTGGMIYVIFCLPVTDVNLTWRTLFLLYLIVGAYMEERKLLAEFGMEYAWYQQEVPMFWPRWRG